MLPSFIVDSLLNFVTWASEQLGGPITVRGGGGTDDPGDGAGLGMRLGTRRIHYLTPV